MKNTLLLLFFLISCHTQNSMVVVNYKNFDFYELQPNNSHNEGDLFFLQVTFRNDNIVKIDFIDKAQFKVLESDSIIHKNGIKYHLTKTEAFRDGSLLQMFNIAHIDNGLLSIHHLLFFKSSYFLISIDSFRNNKSGFVRRGVNLNQKATSKYSSIEEYLSKIKHDVKNYSFYKEYINFILRVDKKNKLEFKKINICDWCQGNVEHYSSHSKTYGNLFLDLKEFDLNRENDSLLFSYTAIPVPLKTLIEVLK